MGLMLTHRGLYMKLKDMDDLMSYSGAELDFLLLLQEFLEENNLSLQYLQEWMKNNEHDVQDM